MIRELKTLIAVAREGTFAAAGSKVGLTQAAVSAQMQRLEAELGFALFDRSRRLARLNASGEEILSKAVDLVSLYRQLGTREGGARAMEPIRIGAIASAQRLLLADVLTALHKQLRDCRTRVVPGLSIDLLERVDAGDIDMAIVIRPPFELQRDLHWTALAHEPFRLLVPRQVAGNDWTEILGSQPFVRYDRASFGGRQVDRFLRSAQLKVQEICELDELDAIVRLVANGLGVALVPQTAAHLRWPAAVRAVDLGRHTFHRDIGLVHRATRVSSDSANLLARLVCSAYSRTRDAADTRQATRSPTTKARRPRRPD